MAEERNVSRREFLKLAGMAGAAIGLGAGLGGLVSACGDEETTTTTGGVATTTGGAATGTVSIIMLGTNQPGLEAVIADFAKEYPGITITPEFINDLQAFDVGVPTRFAAGNGSDLIHLIGGVSAPVSIGAFSKAGLIEDLSSAPWVPTMYEGTKPLMMYDGKVMAKDFGSLPVGVPAVRQGLLLPKTA